MPLDWPSVIAQANRYALSLSPFRADVSIPQDGEDAYGQPMQAPPVVVTDVPAWLASAHHPSEGTAQRVERAGDWHTLYLADDALQVTPRPGSTVTIRDTASGQVVGTYRVTGEPVHQWGRWVCKVEAVR